VATEQEELEREIVRTRAQLGRDVDALTEKVSPTQAAKRRVGRARSALVSAKDTVMGTASDAAGSTRDRASNLAQDVGSTAGDLRETAGQTAQSAGQEVRRRTEGNPLAAGMIAFGIGWLASSVLPATRAEKRLGETVRDVGQEKLAPVKEQATSAAREVAENLKEPAKEAVDSVKETASQATQTVKDEGSSQTQDLTQQTRKSAETVRDESTTTRPY
jgi:uncharacterized protein YjbJ (UPF0337 family)